MDSATKKLMKEIFDSSVDVIRARVREGHLYGAQVNGKEDTILHWKPRQWSNKAVIQLQREFLKKCTESELIISSNRDELVEEFEELLQE